MDRWAVLYGADTRETYALGLVASDGKLVVNLTPKQQFHATAILDAGQKIPAVLVPVSATSDKLYYLDGVVLKYVSPAGDSGTVRSLNGGSREYAFTVTLDDTRIAIAEFDYSNSTPAFHLWMEDLAGGNRTDLHLRDISYAWPFGWYGGQLIVVEAKPYSIVSTEGPPFLPFSRRTHLIDTKTGLETASLCSWPVGVRALCRYADGSLYMATWNDEQPIPEPQVGPGSFYPSGVVSPDGVSIASVDFGCSGVCSNSIVVSDSSGHRTKLGIDGYPEAFLDATHLIYETPAPLYQFYGRNVLDLETGAIHPIDFTNGSCRSCATFGVLPPFQS